MKKFIIIVLVLAVLATACSLLVACSNKPDDEYIAEKGTLVVGITYYEPMNYFDEGGNLVGFDTEFAQAVAKELGLDAKFQIINWESKFLELNAKNIDVIWNGFTVDDERKKEVEFTQSYLNNTQCVVVKADALSTYTSKDSCAGKKAVAEAGSAGENAAKALSDNYTEQSAQTSALTEIKSGTADFAVIDVLMANAMVGKGDYSDLAIATAIEMEPEEYAIGFRKGSPMAAKVNAVIDGMLDNGSLMTIAEKYGVQNALIPKK